MKQVTEEDYQKLIEEITNEFPDFNVKFKHESKFMKLIDVVLKKITFGKMNSFMDNFVTTIGSTMYVPKSWLERPPASRMITTRHERVHLRQAKRYGRFLFSVLYLLIPLPVVFAMFRKKFEQEAYEESLLAMYEYYGIVLISSTLERDHMINFFMSSEYFWMWPWRKSLIKWYDSKVAEIIINDPPTS